MNLKEICAEALLKDAKMINPCCDTDRFIKDIVCVESEGDLGLIQEDIFVVLKEDTLCIPQNYACTLRNLHMNAVGGLALRTAWLPAVIFGAFVEFGKSTNIPVFSLPPSLNWHDIISAANLTKTKCLLTQDNNTFLHLLHNPEKLFYTLKTSSDDKTMLQTIHRTTGLPCSVIRLPIKYVTTFPEQMDISGEINFLIEAIRKPLKKTQERGPVQVFAYSNRRALYTCISPKEGKYVVLWDIENDSLRPWYYSYAYLVILLTLSFPENQSIEIINQTQVNTFLQTFICENRDQKERITSAAESLGISLRERYYIITAHIQEELNSSKNTASILKKRSLTHFFQHIYLERDILGGFDQNNNLLFWVPIDHAVEEDVSNFYIQVDWIARLLHDQFHTLDIQFAGSTSTDHLDGLAQKYREALTALTFARANGLGASHYTQTGLFGLLSQLDYETQIFPFYRRYLGKILSLGQMESEELLQTLYMYALSGFNSRECARRIYLHHNSVRYRLNRIQKLTNLSLSKPDDLVCLLACLIIIKDYDRPELGQLRKAVMQFDEENEDDQTSE